MSRQLDPQRDIDIIRDVRWPWCRRYASGLVNAIASLVLGWGVDRYNWPRTYVLAAASLLLSGMYILEVSMLKEHHINCKSSENLSSNGIAHARPQPCQRAPLAQ